MAKEIWTVKKSLQWTTQYFKREKIKNPRLNAELLLAHILEKSRLELYLEFDRPLSSSEHTVLEKLIIQRSHHIPLAYITKEQDFMGLRFKVNPDVYIPRPETEILVEESLKIVREIILGEKNEGLSGSFIILDLGTGCGNIAIKLAEELEKWKVYAVDISWKALEVARENAKFYNLDKKVTFLPGDLFAPLAGLNLEGKVSLIISNPPYVSSKEMGSLSPEVKKEPRVALDGGKDGLSIHRRIVGQSFKFLRKGGFLVLEVGYKQAQKVRDLILNQKELCAPRIIRDYEGIERIVLVKKGGYLDQRRKV